MNDVTADKIDNLLSGYLDMLERGQNDVQDKRNEDDEVSYMRALQRHTELANGVEKAMLALSHMLDVEEGELRRREDA